MAREKERFEILLEGVNDSVKQIAEGHDTLSNKFELLDNKIDKVHSSIKNEIKFTAEALRDDIRRIEDKLDEHIKEPSHA